MAGHRENRAINQRDCLAEDLPSSRYDILAINPRSNLDGIQLGSHLASLPSSQLAGLRDYQQSSRQSDFRALNLLHHPLEFPAGNPQSNQQSAPRINQSKILPSNRVEFL